MGGGGWWLGKCEAGIHNIGDIENAQEIILKKMN